MSANVGTIDRVFRFILGVVLIALPLVSGMELFQTAWIYWVSLAAGVVMLVTSGLRFCPLYRIFGIRTCAV